MSILVSIYCPVYNQEKYIEKTILGFLKQRVDFEYEIIIHDDASTDTTRTIIKKYVEKYGNIIKPIFQDENQYKKGVKIIDKVLPLVRGKYIAYCEGDDYWTDKNKLQKQVNFMEMHPECSLCVHCTDVVNECGTKTGRKIQPELKDCFLDIKKMIMNSGGYVSTNSMIYRTCYAKKLPKFYYDSPVGDYPLSLYLAVKGKVYYINESMSDYRENALGSWSRSMKLNDENRIKCLDGINNMLTDFNEYSEHEYSDIIKQRIYANRVWIAIIKRDIKEIRNLRKKIKGMSLEKQLLLGLFFPRLYCIMRYIRNNKYKLVI